MDWEIPDQLIVLEIEIMQVQTKMVLQSARKLKNACKYYLKKVIPDRRQKCLIYGNCQTMALMNVLRSWPAFNDCYQILSIPPVFEIKQTDLNRLLEIIAAVDLFIYQPVSDQYRSIPQLSTNFLTSQLKQDCFTISFPSLYFAAYSPEIIYLRQENGTFHEGPAGDYHNLFVVKSYLSSKSVKETVSLLTSNSLFSPEISQQIAKSSLDELRKREETIVRVSDFIQEHYISRRLFHTMNHPSITILRFVALKVMEQLKLSNHPEPHWIFSGAELLNNSFFAIHPSLYQNLSLTFENPPHCTLMGQTMELHEMVECFFQFYDQNPQVIGDFERSKARFNRANMAIELVVGNR